MGIQFILEKGAKQSFCMSYHIDYKTRTPTLQPTNIQNKLLSSFENVLELW